MIVDKIIQITSNNMHMIHFPPSYYCSSFFVETLKKFMNNEIFYEFEYILLPFTARFQLERTYSKLKMIEMILNTLHFMRNKTS